MEGFIREEEEDKLLPLRPLLHGIPSSLVSFFL
jgi:hypothetical protein